MGRTATESGEGSAMMVGGEAKGDNSERRGEHSGQDNDRTNVGDKDS